MTDDRSTVSAGGSYPRILFAHGNAALLARAAHALSPSYRAVTVNTASDAVTAARESPPNLILCSARLRAADGTPLWHALRRDIALQGVPMILAVDGDDRERLDAADDILYEPFNDRDLMARVAVNLKFARERRKAVARERARKTDTEAMLRRLEVVLTHLPFGLTVVNPNWEIVYANPARERLLHFSGQSKVGERLTERLPARHGDGTSLNPDDYPIRRALRGELVTDLEIRYDSSDGSGPHWLRASGIPITASDGTVRYAIGVAVDITAEVRARHELLKLTESLEERVRTEIDERLKAEETLRQVQKMQAIGQLTGGVAHDFNNLLQVMLGNLEAMERHLNDNVSLNRARLSRQVGAALRGAERASRMTQQLLAFSRRQPLNPAPVDVNQLVLRTGELLRRTLGENIIFATRTEPTLKLAFVDENQLEAALLNLAVNARDAMPNGGQLTIATENRSFPGGKVRPWDEFTPGDYIVISVTDTGTGVPEDVMAHIFEPFFTTKEIGRGTGLGLSQAYGFAKQSGGHIAVESKVGVGTVVMLYLPARDAAKSDAITDVETPAQRGSRGEIVLVVEDDPDVRAFSVETLQDLGYSVVEAGNAAEALQRLDREPGIRLMFTDVGLPGGMSGRDLAEQARTRHPRLKVLFTSGYARDAVARRGRCDPDVQLVAKPFTAGTLAARIRELLETA